MNKYEELIYSLICNCNRELTVEEKKILNEADAIYNTYNQFTEQLSFDLTKLQNVNHIYTYDCESKFKKYEIIGINLV